MIHDARVIPLDGRPHLDASIRQWMGDSRAQWDGDTLDYRFTVTDPATFAAPWTAAIPMTAMQGPIFEYACHEGNYSMENMLRGARMKEGSR